MFNRSIKLVGEENFKLLQEATIFIAGLGGVGGSAFNALVRSGFKHFVIIDHDKVDITNLNRQILYTSNDVGRVKVEVAKDYALSIASGLDIKTYQLFIDEESLIQFKNTKIDFIVDAIDKIPSKIAIAKFALSHNIKFISSLGMGNRMNPEDVLITTLNKTENDPLAKKLRYEYRQLGLSLKDIPVIFSKETPIVKSPSPYSIITVPVTAGLLIAKYIILNVEE